MKKISQQKKITFLISFLFILIFAFIGVRLLNNSHATQAIYNGKLIGMNSSLGDPNDIASLNQLGVNSERGEIDMSGTSFGNPNYDGTTANWVDQLTTAHIVPLPIMNQYVEMSTLNQTQFASALVSWCQQYCAGGSFYNNNTSANSAYAPQTLEILNEPCGDWWGYPVTSADVGAYASLLKQIRSSLNSAGLSNIGILAAANDNWGGTINWDNTLATDGGFNYVQGVTVHAYGDHGSGSQYDPNGNIVIPTGSVGSATDGWQQVYYVHQLLDNDGLTAQANSIYVTEDGWCT